MKTIAEAAKEILRLNYIDFDTHKHYYKSEFEMLLQMSKITQRWIPVEEELPEEDTYVLTLSNRHNGDFYYRVIWFRYGGFYSTEQTSNITHWRPIEIK